MHNYLTSLAALDAAVRRALLPMDDMLAQLDDVTAQVTALHAVLRSRDQMVDCGEYQLRVAFWAPPGE